MKHTALTKTLGLAFFLAFAFPAFAQFPNLSGKIAQGKQTTALGITSYSDTVPLHTPTPASWRYNTLSHVDTTFGVVYQWRYPRWYATSVVRQSNPPPATTAAGSNFVDYTETLWQNSTDSLTYYYEEKQQCWEPVGTVVRDTMPVSTSATGTSAAVCYEYSLWYNSTNDSLYAYTAGAWLAVGSGGGTSGAVDSIVVLQDSIIVGYSEGDEVTRDTVHFPAFGTMSGFNITADAGGSTTVGDGGTVDISGGYGINTSNSFADITVEVDTNQIATQSDLSVVRDTATAKINGTLTNLRIPVAIGTKTLGNSTLLQSSTGQTLDANLAFRITGGSTGSRPTGAAGMWYWNTSNNWYDVYDGTGWRNVAQIANTNGLGTSAFVPRFDTNGRLTNGIFRDDGTTAGLGIAASASYGLNMAVGLPSSKIRFELSGTSQAYIDWDAGSTTAYKLGKNATGIYALTAGGSNNTSFGYYHTPSAFNVNNLFEIKAALSVKWRSNTSAHTSIAYFEGTSASTFVQINNNGYLGINAVPTQPLHVTGNGYLSGSLQVATLSGTPTKIGGWTSTNIATVITPTITTAGTTGDITINQLAGTVNIAAAGTTVTVTNSLVTANSLVFCTLRTNDTTATVKNVVAAAGSFTINLAAAATGEVSIGFFVVN